MRAARTAVCLAVAVATSLSACSSGPAEKPGATDDASTPAGALTAPATFEDLDAAGMLAPATVDTSRHQGLGLVAEGQVSDEYGTYEPLHLAADAPIYTVDPDLVPVDLGVDTAFLDALVRDAADYVVTSWVDGPALWADDAAARDALTAASHEVLGDWDLPLLNDLDVDASDGYAAVLDHGRWRQEAGLTPVYPAQGPRLGVKDLAVSLIEPYVTDDGRHGAWVTVDASFSEPVTDAQGAVRAMSQSIRVSVGRLVEDGLGTVSWSGRYSLGLDLAEGLTIDDLPVLDVDDPTTPDGWTTATLGDLTYGVPAGAVLSRQDADSARYTLPDDAGELRVGRNLSTDITWSNVATLRTFGLRVPGAVHSAGEYGPDTAGVTEAELWVYGPSAGDGAAYYYWVKWPTTDETALDEVTAMAGTLSVG